MGELLKKPYEISVWEDELVTQNGKTFYQEKKLAIIGSDSMTGKNRIYDPVFTKNFNGEKTLTFSLTYKYFEPYSGIEGFVNPFAALLINERKVKLKYDDQWYDFIIKEHTESSDGLVWTYSCVDAFIQELSKTGYHLVFSADENNNQGTAKELAQKVLEDTDWQVGDSDTLTQFVEDPIYKAVLKSTTGITIINASEDGTAIPSVNSNIYVFYSYIKNKDGQFVQFIIRDNNRKYDIDDKNVIKDTNFRITTPLVYDENANAFKKDGNTIIQINTNSETHELDVDTQYHAYRLAYNQLTTYDPVLERTVKRYNVSGRNTEVYSYIDYQYTTSNVVTNFITNGDNFSVITNDEGTIPQGWSGYTRHTGAEPTKIKLASRPELSSTQPLATLNSFGEIESFLAIDFNGPVDDYYRNTVFNSGIEDNASIIGSIKKGEQFLFRWRGGSATEHGPIYDNAVRSIKMIVAKYTLVQPDGKDYYLRIVDRNNIILNFDGESKIADSYIDGGNLVPLYRLTKDTTVVTGKTYYTRSGTVPNYTYEEVSPGSAIDSQLPNYYVRYFHYAIDGVTQEPSTKYIYRVKSGSNVYQYKWDPDIASFVSITAENPFRNYFYITATATQTITEEELSDTETNIGIFLYTTYEGSTEAGVYFYLQDVQLTRYYSYDDNGVTRPVLLGNIPEAKTIETTYYYEKPKSTARAQAVPRFISLEGIAAKMAVSVNAITPKYNEESEKILSINESQSNCFNILQSIAETFECWIDIDVKHNPITGEILRVNGKPQKYIRLLNFIGKDNGASFKYGVNLSSIERTVTSDEIVTKLIVEQTQSNYVDGSFTSIQKAKSNPSGESYILNFNYYLNQGLFGDAAHTNQCRADINSFNNQLKNYNNQLNVLNRRKEELTASLTVLDGQRKAYAEMVKTAKDNVNKKITEFEALTKKSYHDYQAQHMTIADLGDKFTEEKTLLAIIGDLYENAAVINNFNGFASNSEQEYWETRRALKGLETYYITVEVRLDGNQNRHIVVTVSDYIVGTKFTIGSTQYVVTTSNNVFDIVTNATTITFNAVPIEFQINAVGPQTINDSEIKTYMVSPKKNIDSIEAQIERVQTAKDNLTKDFNKKYSRFIQEGTWSSTDYIDSELYYLSALQVSNTSAQPVVEYSIDVVEISEIEGYEYYKFDVGDKTFVEDTEFFGWHVQNVGSIEDPRLVLTPAREEVIISEVEWHLDDPSNNVIKIQNYKTRFEDLFQRISAAVQTVQYNEATYAKITTLLDEDGTLNQNILLTAMNNLAGKEHALTSDGSVFIQGDQIVVRNLPSMQNCVIISSKGIGISTDGGKNCSTVIDAHGINLDNVRSSFLNTDLITIGNTNNPSFRWDRSGINAYKSSVVNEQEQYDLQTFVRFDQYGLYGIKNNGSFYPQTLQDIKNKAHFAVTWDGFFIKNSYTGGGKVQITSENDFQVINSNQTEKIKIGALEWTQNGVITTTPIPGVAPSLYGIRINNNAGTTVFKTGDDGNITITGTINANAGEIGGMIVNDDKLTMNHIILEPGVGIYSNYSTPTPFIISDTDGSATFNQITARGHIEAQTGTLGLLTVQDTITVGDSTHNGTIQSYGYVTGNTGWAIKSNGTAEFQNATIRGHIDATSGTLNNLDITGGITVVSNGYVKSNNFDANENTGWKITDTGAVFNNVTARGHIEAATGTLGDLDVIDTITVGANGAIESSNYSTVNHTGWHIDDTSATFNNANVRGTITALQGDFLGAVRVGPTSQGQDHIIIDGTNALIRSSNYQDGAGYGWMINKDGDAVFNNITARGAIRTAVFEYAEIQAVGGIFIFRPSSTIREAVIAPNETDLIITVEKPYLFEVGAWCKISNYIDDGTDPDVRVNNILLTNGLTHVYRVSAANGKVVTLAGAAAMVEGAEAVVDIDSLVGGALIDMGNKANGNGEVGTHNYGIGINSSDNTVNLPARAITLFETVIDETRSPKVSYKYRGILGTLPNLPVGDVKQNIYPPYMAGKQGIYTDNMYIGDNQQYIAFYTDADDLDEDQKPKKKLRISAREMVFGYDPDTGEEITWEEKIEEASQGADAVYVVVDSTAGNFFQHGQVNTYLVAHVYRGSEDVTSEFSVFHWYRRLPNGNVDPTWSTQETSNLLQLTTADVDERAVFVCEVTIA